MTISDLTGIPRPTVIRKLKVLLKQKDIFKDNNNLYYMTKGKFVSELNKLRLNNIIENGGWHFCNLKKPEQLLHKYKNLCETNDPYIFKEKINQKYLDINNIKKFINEGKDIIGRNDRFKAVALDNKFPDYLISNVKNYSDWLIST